MCCQVGISALGWSLVQSSPTEFGVLKLALSWNLDNEEALVH